MSDAVPAARPGPALVPPTRIGFSLEVFSRSLVRALIAAAIFAACLFLIMRSPPSAQRFADPPWWAAEWTQGGFVFLVAVSGFFTFYMLYRACFRSHRASCPDCKREVTGLSGGGKEFLLCAGCKRFLRESDHQLHHVDEDCLWEAPVFGSRLPDEPRLPAKCCVCLGPEARRLTHRWSYSTVRAGSRVPQRHDNSIELPYCAAHAEGAQVLQWSASSAVIRFRSLPYLREFCKANNTGKEV